MFVYLNPIPSFNNINLYHVLGTVLKIKHVETKAFLQGVHIPLRDMSTDKSQ